MIAPDEVTFAYMAERLLSGARLGYEIGRVEETEV